jgi:cytoskeletal protein CcmA (bactofilin family)
MFNAKKEAHMANAGETIIAQGVRVEGDFHSQGDVVIDGEVQGNIFVTGMLELLSTSKVVGDISTGSISVAAGAELNGRVSMGQNAAQSDEGEE